MSRVDDLQKKYPNLNREFIIKWDALNHGVQDSDALDKRGMWIRNIGDYTRDHKRTLQQSVKDKPQRVRPGWIKYPTAFFMRGGFGAQIKRDPDSPYVVKEVGDGQFALYEGEEKVEDVWFPGAAVGEPGDKDFWPGNLMSGTNQNCGFGSGADVPMHYQLQHCGYFTTGDQCRFCNYNANHDDAAAVGLRPPKPTLDQVIENYSIRARKLRIIEVHFGADASAGLRGDQSKITEFYTNFIDRVASATPYHLQLRLTCMPLNRKQFQRLKDVGLTIPLHQMEVNDREMFPEIIPGKAKQFGFDGYMESFQEAVDIFGAGNVTAGLIAGMTQIPEKGHKTWQEARDSFIEGDRMLIKNGVVPVWTSFRPVPGSTYGDDPSTLAKLAPTELYIECAQGDHAAMKEYGFYEKMNKFALCPLDCIGLYYVGDLGMVEFAGNPGNWLADRIPYEINWLAKFIDQVKATAPASA